MTLEGVSIKKHHRALFLYVYAQRELLCIYNFNYIIINLILT